MTQTQPRSPWNKGKSVGPKRPLTLVQARAIATHLETTHRTRDLALFATAFDTMLRGIDLLRLTVADVTTEGGGVREYVPVFQRKTGRSHLTTLTANTQATLSRWIAEAGLKQSDFLFSNVRGPSSKPLSTDQYRKLVKQWVMSIGLDPTEYSSHSMRRTKAVLVFMATGDIGLVRLLLGHANIASTTSYLGSELGRALDVSKRFEL